MNSFLMLIPVHLCIWWNVLKGRISMQQLCKYKNKGINTVDDIIRNGLINEQKWKQFVVNMDKEYGLPCKNITFNWIPGGQFLSYMPIRCQRKYVNNQKYKQIEEIYPNSMCGIGELIFWQTDILKLSESNCQRLLLSKNKGICCLAMIHGQILNHFTDYALPLYVYIFNYSITIN